MQMWPNSLERNGRDFWFKGEPAVMLVMSKATQKSDAKKRDAK